MTQRGIYLVALAIIIATGTTWALNKWRQQITFTESRDASQINAYMSNFTAYSTTAKGKAQYTLTADHSTNQSNQSLTQIFHPRYIMKTEAGEIIVNADKATENKLGDIELTGKVIIQKEKNSSKTGYKIQTEHLLYSPHSQIIDTDMPVKIVTTDNLTINSDGLNEDLSSQITQLKSNVHTNYAPPTQNTH